MSDSVLAQFWCIIEQRRWQSYNSVSSKHVICKQEVVALLANKNSHYNSCKVNIKFHNMC